MKQINKNSMVIIILKLLLFALNCQLTLGAGPGSGVEGRPGQPYARAGAGAGAGGRAGQVYSGVGTKPTPKFCTTTLGLGDNEQKSLAAEDENVINQLLGCSQTMISASTNCEILTSDTVTCNCSLDKEFCRVIDIRMSYRGLGVKLPEKMGSLTHLKILILVGNKLRGQIPLSYANLKNLEYLNLQDNFLEGPIPPVLGDMKLNVLVLSKNSFSGAIPTQLGSLVNLTYLDLADNLFNGSIPPQLRTLVNLTYLDLSNNLLSEGIPSEIGKLKSLVTLNLRDNNLSGNVPEQLGDLALLQYLYLQNNEFVGELPTRIMDMVNLTALNVRGNNFSAPIPNSIGHLVNLTYLSLMGSNFEGPMPGEISKLTNLEYLFISDLVGGDSQFPDFSNMNSLRYLTLRKCSLVGPIPDTIWKLKSLYFLDLSFNSLIGEIPKDLSSLYQPRYIFLRGNKLNGKIPKWIMNSTWHIDVSENLFANDVSEIPNLSSNSSDLNFFSCLNSSDVATHWAQVGYSCSNKEQLFERLYINCGGESMKINGSNYEADMNSNGSSTFFLSSSSNWGYSSMGSYLPSVVLGKYMINNTCTVGVGDEPLYSTARISPVSLKYYGFCLRNDEYTVKLHFAELVGNNYKTPYINKSCRIFDVDIQGNNELKNFNIEKEAGGVNKAITVERNVNVNNSRLEIHLYWSGKGSTVVPTDHYGPLISAISVYPSRENGLSPLTIAGISFSALLLLIVLIVYFWKMEDKPHEGMVELYPGGLYNFKNIKAAANNFKEELGKGGFGTFYEATIGNGTVVAVEKVSATKDIVRAFREKDSTISLMEHPNFVKLMGCIAEKNQLLLVYEDIGRNSLQNALFDSNRTLDWPTRHKICLGIAEGLAFLHECKQNNVHGNIKPTCIFLDKQDNAKISDLGFAKLHDKTRSLVDGTAIYVAPEYFKPIPVITPKADVFSFGALMLVVVSGNNEMTISMCGGESVTEYLPDMVAREMKHGSYMHLVDKSLCNKVDWGEAETILELAMLCLDQYPDQRPIMSQAVDVLKEKLKLDDLKKSLKQPTSGMGSEPRGEIFTAEDTTHHSKSRSTSRGGMTDTSISASPSASSTV